MGGLTAVAVAGLLAAAYDPVIDTQLVPHAGLSLGVGVQRLHDDFGVQAQLTSPRFLDGHLAVRLTGGLGWYPDLRAIPEDATDQDFDARALYGHTRLVVEASLSLALIPGRLYAAVGPSALFLPERVSTTRVGLGVYGVAGVELFTGDAYRTWPLAFFFEIGATSHAAAADVVSRTGPIEVTDLTVDRPIATGLALSGGIRWYLWP